MAAFKIGLVGPCAAGKTTLAALLAQRGYQVKHIAQEHSYVPYMWQRISRPDVLIYLDVSYEMTIVRRKLNWSFEEYEVQLRRLAHARQHADLYLHTDPLTPEQILELIIQYLKAKSLP